MIVRTCTIRRFAVVANSNEELENDNLISQARSSYNAFALLYRRHYDAVFKYCVHRLFHRHLAEDVTSEVFLKVVEKFHGFKGGERQFRNWLYKIATNEVNNHLRRAARRSGLLERFRERSGRQTGGCRASTDETGEKSALFYVDKDVDDLLRIRRRSEHFIYSEFYDVLNHIFRNGDLVPIQA
jgi:RNA polymerase sigma-70 factor (ECF subfamily)